MKRHLHPASLMPMIKATTGIVHRVPSGASCRPLVACTCTCTGVLCRHPNRPNRSTGTPAPNVAVVTGHTYRYDTPSYLSNHTAKWSSAATLLSKAEISDVANSSANTYSDSSVPDFSDVPGVKTGGDKYVIVFTCTKCDTRSAKKISKKSYHHGVVVVRCACCQNLHLIADHIGVFEEKGWDIQKFLDAAHDGANPVKVVNEDNVLELSPEDLLGNNRSSLLTGEVEEVPTAGIRDSHSASDTSLPVSGTDVDGKPAQKI